MPEQLDKLQMEARLGSAVGVKVQMILLGDGSLWRRDESDGWERYPEGAGTALTAPPPEGTPQQGDAMTNDPRTG